MSKQENFTFGFYRYDKGNYLHNEPLVVFGIYPKTLQGCLGEMEMRWECLTWPTPIYPKLHCWHDGFSSLVYFAKIFADIFQKFENDIFTIDEFVEILLANGFTDLTKYEES